MFVIIDLETTGGVFNKEKIIANSSYYLDGSFSKKDLNIKFKKAYFLEGNFIMLDAIGRYKNIKFKSKKINYYQNSLFFKEVFLFNKEKKFRKLKYELKI